MSANKETKRKVFDFFGESKIEADGTDSALPWRSKISAAGAGTVVVEERAAKLTQTNAINQTVALDFGGQASFKLLDLIRIEFLFKTDLPNTESNVEVLLGLYDAYNDDPTAVARYARFNIGALGKVKAQGDDNTTVTEASSDIVPVGDWFQASIDLNYPGPPISVPGVKPAGRDADVKFAIGDPANLNSKRMIGESTTFDLSGVTQALQPFAMIHTGGSAPAGTTNLWIRSVTVDYKDN